MDLSPKQIVDRLNKHIIGQNDAKKAVAIALRNRYRRAQLPKEIREEITPKNIIMKGPTGVGKTEIARRLAKLVKAPFVKVEATKYTEVGYVGKDVEGMIRDLAECAYRLVKSEQDPTATKPHNVPGRPKSSVALIIGAIKAKLLPRKTGTLPLVMAWKISVPIPAVRRATDGSKPTRRGTNTVAPNATNRNWAPTTTF